MTVDLDRTIRQQPRAAVVKNARTSACSPPPLTSHSCAWLLCRDLAAWVLPATAQLGAVAAAGVPEGPPRATQRVASGLLSSRMRSAIAVRAG